MGARRRPGPSGTEPPRSAAQPAQAAWVRRARGPRQPPGVSVGVTGTKPAGDGPRTRRAKLRRPPGSRMSRWAAARSAARPPDAVRPVPAVPPGGSGGSSSRSRGRPLGTVPRRSWGVVPAPDRYGYRIRVAGGASLSGPTAGLSRFRPWDRGSPLAGWPCRRPRYLRRSAGLCIGTPSTRRFGSRSPGATRRGGGPSRTPSNSAHLQPPHRGLLPRRSRRSPPGDRSPEGGVSARARCSGRRAWTYPRIPSPSAGSRTVSPSNATSNPAPSGEAAIAPTSTVGSGAR